ncbi:MAG: diiron oxygenase [Sneathiellaceae bacterium]
MQDFGGFCETYLQRWEQRCTVRNAERTRFRELAPDDPIFPLSLQPVAAHPDVAALGADGRRELLVRSAFAMQSGIAGAEVDVVALLCGRLANGRHDFGLPRSARQVALAVGVDEFYHALVAREFIEDLSWATGIEPGREVRPEAKSGIEIGLDYLREACPAELLPLAELVALCFAEHFVTESMFDTLKSAPRDAAYTVATREHMIDEGRHQRFFELLLQHVWIAIDEERRIAFGRLLPGFLDAFLASFPSIREQYVSILGALGFAEDRGSGILDEVFAVDRGDAPPPAKHEFLFARHSLSLLQISDLVSHGPTRQCLVDAGWWPAPAESELSVA